MKPYIPLIFVFCWCFATLTVQAQNNTEKTVTDATQALGTLKGLFGKKKAAKKDSVATVKNGAVTKSAESSNTSALTTTGKGVFIAGKLASNVKYIDYDRAEPFNHGVTVIQKGASYAMIDTAGNFVVPFNKYKSIYTAFSFGNTVPNGLFLADTYCLNTHGKVIFDEKEFQRGGAMFSSDSKFATVLLTEKESSKLIIIDEAGKRIILNVPSAVDFNYFNNKGLSDSVVVYGTAKGYSFMHMNGKNFIENFYAMGPFSNGLSIFTIKNQYGEYKNGVINNKGKIILQPEYSSSQLELFNSGIICLRGGTNDDFTSVFLNSNGQLIYKGTKDSQKQYGYFGRFYNGYSCSSSTWSGVSVMDRSGKMTSQSDFLNSIGIPVGKGQRFSNYNMVTPSYDFEDGNLHFNVTDNVSKKGYVGLYNIYTHQTVLFEQTSIMSVNAAQGRDFYYYTDPVSHLTYAKIPAPQKNPSGQIVNIDGFVNQKGEYVIVKAQAKSAF